MHTIGEISFILITDPKLSHSENSERLSEIYKIYCDYVNKDPFYVEG